MQACTDLVSTVNRLQRECLHRTRLAIFSAIDGLGGVPSEAEETEQETADAQIRAYLSSALVLAVNECHPGHIPFAKLAPEQRAYWGVRGPVVAAFGFRTCRMLSHFGTFELGDNAEAMVAALFQLAASYVDWLADEAGMSPEIADHLSTDTVRVMAFDRAVRQALVAELQQSASIETVEFAVLLSTLFDLIDRLPSAPSQLRELVCRSYVAELESFSPIKPHLDLLDVAYAKSVMPTLVIGELALIHSDAAGSASVWAATLAMGPVFGFVDDVQDLSRDLRHGDINGLCPTRWPLTDAETCETIEALLRSDVLERAAADVAIALHRIDRLLAERPCDDQNRSTVLLWLRVVLWRWLA